MQSEIYEANRKISLFGDDDNNFNFENDFFLDNENL